MDLYKKTYGVFGLAEYSTIIPAGNGHIRVEFTDGSMTVRGITPATFTTSNEAVQAAIESSGKFVKGKIKLISKEKIGNKVVVVPPEPEEEPQEENAAEEEEAKKEPQGEEDRSVASFPEVVNSQQAKEVLRSAPYNVKLDELGSKSEIKEKAEKLRVSFPNWK